MTSVFRTLPDFAILGAQKSGTSSMYWYLSQHPGIIPAVQKEIYYFTSVPLYNGGDRSGQLWYRSHFPTAFYKWYLGKRLRHKAICGEATPCNLYYPSIPRRMKGTLPDIRLIAILRNPVDRAYSHYNMNIRARREYLSFEDAIDVEESKMSNELYRIQKTSTDVPHDSFFHGWSHFLYHSYLKRGLYAAQLENWFSHYDRKQFLILTTEELTSDVQGTMNRVFEFLGCEPFELADKKNKNPASYAQMNPDTREKLVEYFRPHNEELGRLLERSFEGWNR